MSEDDTFEALRRPMTKDEVAFGRKTWIYCNQHMAYHLTGWCTVSNRDKVKLDATNEAEAYSECRKKEYRLYSYSQPKDA